MINLLPPEDKKEIRAGKANALLTRYILLTLVLGIAITTQLGYAYMQITKSQADADRAITDSQTKDAALAKDKQNVEEFRNNLAIAKQVLNNRVNYSTLYTKIAAVIPKGVILEKLTIDPAKFGTATTLTAHAKSEADARNLKDSLEKSGYFTNVQFNSLAIVSGGAKSDYPYDAILNVTLRKELING